MRITDLMDTTLTCSLTFWIMVLCSFLVGIVHFVASSSGVVFLQPGRWAGALHLPCTHIPEHLFLSRCVAVMFFLPSLPGGSASLNSHSLCTEKGNQLIRWIRIAIKALNLLVYLDSTSYIYSTCRLFVSVGMKSFQMMIPNIVLTWNQIWTFDMRTLQEFTEFPTVCAY